MITTADLPRLHSATVRTLSGSVIGHVSGVLLDDDGQPVVLAVRKRLLSVGEVLVPVAGAVLIGRDALIPVSDAAIAAAPTGGDLPDDELVAAVLAWWDSRMLHGAERLESSPALAA